MTINVEQTFRFRAKNKDGSQKAALTLALTLLTVSDLVDILSGDDTKQINFLVEAANDIILTAAKQQLNTSDTLTSETLTWQYLASVPKTERQLRGIPVQLWADFHDDYIDVMTSQGVNLAAAEKAAALFKQKLVLVKTNKPLLVKLQTRLDVYTTTSANAGQFTAIIEVLNSKLDAYINADENDLLDNI